MRSIDEQSAEAYLRETGRIGPRETVHVRELSGGVSNMVLLVDRPEHPGAEFVLKQARAQLRTRHAWWASVERVWREAEVLAICTRLLKSATERSECPADAPLAQTPQILFEDRENHLFAMSAAPRPNTVWKQDLLAGRLDPRVAAACGRLLGTLHALSWLDPVIAEQIGDCTLFDQLRIDPYYRTLAEAHPEMRGELQRLIDSLAQHPCSLVHADFSPKNLLVFSGGLMMVDFETGHYGDPAFDLGFFLSHLVLKACHNIPRHAAYLDLSKVFCKIYCDVLGPRIGIGDLSRLWARGAQHFAGCAWARLDGKSPVDYLVDPRRRDLVRGLCREIFSSRPRTWPDVIALCEDCFREPT
ncbi:MAG: phosphotransferase [Planctomycetia bacterium]|nr:phosphotransferase [Planctomycetia bacterium]